MAIYVGFLVAFGDALPSIGGTFSCSSPYLNCISSSAGVLGDFIVIVFKVVTLGGFSSPLPILIQAPVALTMALAWSPYIIQGVVNIAAAFIP